MGCRSQTIKKALKAAFTLIVIVVCILPVLYFGVYRMADYVVCRSIVSVKLGMGLSPTSIEGYVEKSITPGMSRDAAITKLKALGRIEVIRGGLSEEVILKYCSHPLNEVFIAINCSPAGEIELVKILGD